jgi:hypothetical protein
LERLFRTRRYRPSGVNASASGPEPTSIEASTRREAIWATETVLEPKFVK